MTKKEFENLTQTLRDLEVEVFALSDILEDAIYRQENAMRRLKLLKSIIELMVEEEKV